MTDNPRPRAHLGRVVAGVVGAMGLGWPRLLVLIVFIGWEPAVLIAVFRPWELTATAKFAPVWASNLAISLGQIVIGAVYGAAVSHITLTALSGRSPSLAQSIARALQRLPILAPYAIIGGLLQLVAPVEQLIMASLFKSHRFAEVTLVVAAFGFGAIAVQLFLSILAGVYVPVAVAESRGLWSTFMRSVRLMSRNRWVFLAALAAIAVVETLVRLFTRLVPCQLCRPEALAGLRVQDVMTLPGWFLGALLLVFVAAFYRELVRSEDGVAEDEIAQLFE
jgi:hypothetical protein